MRYFLVRYMPKDGDTFPIQKDGVKHPAYIDECWGSPLGIEKEAFEYAIKDPFERALILSVGIIIEWQDFGGFKTSYSDYKSGFVKRAWRVKKSKWTYMALVRGHPLKVKKSCVFPDGQDLKAILGES